ncbi:MULTISPECIES: xanthine dehydrogenase family protein subunit M [Ramlibacter]|uniref:Xanthine dehydrogenase family protein subunit M n=1 Tax=Ramlibacter aquaticus TaxID=2780094 RepID=A0ABR9SG16_9BURK|nr:MULTISPECIES: xanthine dehydrogenase family protein subunit M [Ramlibacter]MBE7941293.1 xanthine dehydrogenase family protein subunit M [Ramlibacter aquaticus]
MKAPPFDYVKASSLAEALDLLARHGDDARILAGGQTLLATLNMRLSEPTLLIDITGLADLRGIQRRGDRLFIGALATHTDIESSALVAEHAPMLAAAAPHIAHRAIRNAGTWGGSIAYADPAAEWPCCLCALEGVVSVQGPGGERRIPATEFFQDLYTTDLQPGEIVTGADVPLATTADWFAFDELARRHGDYAVAGLAVAARFDGTVAREVRLSFLGLGATPVRARQTEALLAGKALDDATLEIAAASLKSELDPMPDLTHSAETKRHLATVLARRLLRAARASRAAITA